jgi:hypothetical protein
MPTGPQFSREHILTTAYIGFNFDSLFCMPLTQISVLFKKTNLSDWKLYQFFIILLHSLNSRNINYCKRSSEGDTLVKTKK